MATEQIGRARSLRRNLTDAERRLWQKLRLKQLAGHRFRRQMPLGPYIVDFVCLEAKLVVEVDGGQHADQAKYDEVRDGWLKAQGFRVLRFWNNDVLNNCDEVVEVIYSNLTAAHPHPDLPPSRGKE
ncbi:MAG: endonuclease domain-containing protein [Betaproteobacteria bacterium]|nr:endonuclease domain-containing protein [Betaproteobacteria bacterium]